MGEILTGLWLLPAKEIIDICKTYTVEQKTLYGGAKLLDEQVILLGLKHAYIINEQTKKMQTFEIKSTMFNHKKCQIDINYKKQADSEEISQTSFQCERADLELLFEQYEKAVIANDPKLLEADTIQKKKQKYFEKIRAIFICFTILLGALVYCADTFLKLPILLFSIEWLPIYFAIAWFLYTRHLIKYKQYSKEFSYFTILAGVMSVSILTASKGQFDIGYGLFGLLLIGPACYDLYQFNTVEYDKKWPNISAGFIAMLCMSAGGILYLVTHTAERQAELGVFKINLVLLAITALLGGVGIFFIFRKYKLEAYILYGLLALSLSLPGALNFDHQFNVKNGDKREAWNVQLINNIPVYMKTDKTIDTKDKPWIEIEQDGNYIIDDFLFLLNPSDVIKNIQKMPEIKENDSEIAEYLFEIERTDQYGNHFTSKEYWHGYKKHDSQKQNILHFARLVADDSRNYTSKIDTVSDNALTRKRDENDYIPNWSAQVHTEQLGENKLIITQCQNVYGFSDNKTYECASLFKPSGEMIVGGLPYMPIQTTEPYVMKTNMRGLTYTILKDGTYTVEKEPYYRLIAKEKGGVADVDVVNIKDDSITLSKSKVEKIFLLEQTKDSGSKEENRTFVVLETNLVYTQRNNKFFEISYDLGTAVEISNEKYVNEFSKYAKKFPYNVQENGVIIISNMNDYQETLHTHQSQIMNKEGKLVSGFWFFTSGKDIYEYEKNFIGDNHIKRLNPDLTEDTTFDQTKFNRIFGYKGKTYFYNDKAPSEMYDENGTRVELK